MNNVGYARVSTDDQTLALQLDACERLVARSFMRTGYRAPRRIGPA
jgi:DNA invertase Pin-like site-specific DNA recombinase